MSKEYEFTTEQILAGLDTLSSEEVEPVAPCTHRYRHLFPQIAKEARASNRNGQYNAIQKKYAHVFKEIATCHTCVEEYLMVVRQDRLGLLNNKTDPVDTSGD